MANEMVKSNSQLNFSRESSLKIDETAPPQLFGFKIQDSESKTTSKKLSESFTGMSTSRAYEKMLQELESEVRGHIRF